MRNLLLALTALVVSTAPAAAIITGGSAAGSPDFIKLIVPVTESTPDNTVGNDNFNSPNLFGFDEDQTIALPFDINVDILASTGLPGTLSAGTVVASHYIFFDPDGDGLINGRVSFNSNIVAVIFTRNNLAATDSLIHNGVTYLNPGLRGLEAGDMVSIFDANTLSFITKASTPGDYVRVLTAFSPDIEVPAPAAIALFGLGLAALGLRRKA
jgi:hypothetical protein